MSDLTHVSLFTGIGGLDLAAEWAGFESVLQVERDPYCLRVLEKHWPDVPRITDIREVHADDRWRRPTVVSGGFPCQPFSHAGKRAGADDDRYLWPEMLRVVHELRPLYVVAENVSGLLSINDGLVFEIVLSDLESEGYTVLPFHYPAAGVGANHRRDRVFIVGHASGQHILEENTGRQSVERAILETARRDKGTDRPYSASEDVANANAKRWPRRGTQTRNGTRGAHKEQPPGRYKNVADTDNPSRTCGRKDTGVGAEQADARTADRTAWQGANQWAVEPDVGRVVNGVPQRVDRLRALGNAVVPQQAYPIFRTIADMEAVNGN